MWNQMSGFSTTVGSIFSGNRADKDARRALIPLQRELSKTLKDHVARLKGAPRLDLHWNEELQVMIENLTLCYTAVRRVRMAGCPVTPQQAAHVIENQIEHTKRVIRDHPRIGEEALNIGLKTLNVLFAAQQDLKLRFLMSGGSGGTDRVTEGPETRLAHPNVASLVMQLDSAMLFQLRQALFPPERMIVGAGRRSDDLVRIDALFDVTGVASVGGVKADPDRLGRALIAMSQSGTYMALWVHSHPGRGAGGTHPSDIDLRQHAEWLKDYSPELVSVIMVADSYLRFWGTAVKDGKISVSIIGDGVSVISSREHIYRLDV